MFVSCPGMGVAPSLATAKCVLLGNGPSLCRCLALVKNHSRVSQFVIPSSKGYYEAVQWDNIQKEPSTWHTVSMPHMLFIIFYRDLEHVHNLNKSHFFFLIWKIIMIDIFLVVMPTVVMPPKAYFPPPFHLSSRQTRKSIWQHWGPNSTMELHTEVFKLLEVNYTFNKRK